MMKAVVDRFTRAGFQGEQLLLSFERRMQCGIGICGHCMMGEKRVCKDGPVISFYDVKDTLENCSSRLLKNAHLRRCPHPSSLRRTGLYDSLLGPPEADKDCRAPCI